MLPPPLKPIHGCARPQPRSGRRSACRPSHRGRGRGQCPPFQSADGAKVSAVPRPHFGHVKPAAAPQSGQRCGSPGGADVLATGGASARAVAAASSSGSSMCTSARTDGRAPVAVAGAAGRVACSWNRVRNRVAAAVRSSRDGPSRTSPFLSQSGSESRSGRAEGDRRTGRGLAVLVSRPAPGARPPFALMATGAAAVAFGALSDDLVMYRNAVLLEVPESGTLAR